MSPSAPQLSPDAGALLSPCTGVCTVGPNNLCIGCLRSTDEIGNWTNFTASQRSRILAELPGRLETLFAV